MRIQVEDYRAGARQKLPRFVFDYVDGGAGDEQCLAANRADLDRLRLLPRVLQDTQQIDTAVEVFGQRWRAPLGVAPLGLTGLIRPGGDLAMAQAAAQTGLPYTLSTASNSRIEQVHAAAPEGVRWMQLYVMHERSIAEQIVRRARRENFGALVLTVDVPVGGNRERDLRHGFKLPLRPGPAMAFDVLRHPAWLARLLRHGAPGFVNLQETDDGRPSAQVQALLLARAMDRRLSWDALAWLRRGWDGPLLVKGVLHPDDVRRLVKEGIDGVIVSNHGGRQLDAAPSSISMLPAALDAAEGRVPVFVDGGFRRGTHIAAALALGAKAVFVGRAPMYGLACDGRDGAARVLELLVQELEHTLTLLGCSCIAALQPGQVTGLARLSAG